MKELVAKGSFNPQRTDLLGGLADCMGFDMCTVGARGGLGSCAVVGFAEGQQHKSY